MVLPTWFDLLSTIGKLQLFVCRNWIVGLHERKTPVHWENCNAMFDVDGAQSLSFLFHNQWLRDCGEREAKPRGEWEGRTGGFQLQTCVSYSALRFVWYLLEVAKGLNDALFYTFLGLKQNIPDYHPRPFHPLHMGVPPPPIRAVNAFTPKSDQLQISPAASPEILPHTVWRTWLLIACSSINFSLPHLYISL